MSLSENVCIGSIKQLKTNGQMSFARSGRDFVVFWSESLGEAVCFVDRCSHQDVKLSDFGRIEEDSLVCLAHGAKFQLASGEPQRFPACKALKKINVRILDDEIYVKSSELESAH